MTATAVAAREQGVLSCHYNRPDGPLDGVRIQFQVAIFQKEDQPGPLIERIAHGVSQTGTTGDAGDLLSEPDVHRLNERPTALLTCQAAIFGGLAADIGLNSIERCDTQKGFLGERGLRGDLDLVELPPRVCPAEGDVTLLL